MLSGIKTELTLTQMLSSKCYEPKPTPGQDPEIQITIKLCSFEERVALRLTVKLQRNSASCSELLL